MLRGMTTARVSVWGDSERPLYVFLRGVRMFSRLGGQAVRPLEPV